MALLLAGIFILSSGIILIMLSSLRIPDFHSLGNRKVVNSTQIYDRTGKILLYDIHQDAKRTEVPFEQMGLSIKNATVAIEDSEFYTHGGIRITSIARAVLSNLFHIGIGGGGSTITQQLVKNALLTQKRSYVRKIKEWVLAMKIDNSMPKEKILEAYLNEVPYGGNIYGIEAASKTYFNKNAWDLTLAEAAYLASIPQSPTMLSPYGKNRNKLDERKNLVLARMLELKFITREEYDNAKNEAVAFLPQATWGIKAPHFVFFIKDYLEQKYGATSVESGGLKITTTIDAGLQEKAEQVAKEGALKNEKDWNGKNAGLVAIDPKTGQILTMVGSRDYFDKTIDGNFNIATAARQPGSSFKPFIYATAFNKGFTPDTVLFDLPTEFQTTCDASGRALPGRNQDDCYMPKNYDGKHRGPIALRDALAQSINIPAVKLFYLAGLSDSLKTAENMGISTLKDIGRYGLTLVIGGGEVSLLDMTSAYGVFANNGIKNPYTGILKVEDLKGKVLEEFRPKPQEVLPKNTALIISDILSDEEARQPTFGIHSALYVPGKEVAVKTGTTNSNKDAWIIGYTPSLAVGVWAGNNENTPMKKGGAAMAGPIWNKFMGEALKNLPNESFEEPNLEIDEIKVKPVLRGQWLGNENFFIDKISGKLATENTPKETLEEKVITNVHSILYWVNKNDILEAAPANPTDDSQFHHWEIPVQNWWTQNKDKYSATILEEKPTATDDVHIDSAKPKVSILEPNSAKIYSLNQKIDLKISSSGLFPLQKIDIFINGLYLETTEAPFNFSFRPEELENLQRDNELKIISYDVVYNRSETAAVFSIEQ
ncbi:MAG: Penicillin-binding protein, 1A family [Candidatus Nomurabacteria bacterium GW2011_GWB1_40_7]|uniref:Penicillin-binding protein, 1A family n=1 Tax=Candidatus Nomurabacteria bacterium GW2011_GWB1_40_7 TaxID=1618744 RepID=A0A0G0W5G6_9BACT|nr:MAG: Penicillin-binding protein, 1A family [Candidatus Nomurabacteria bacterium GW2011_GWB1_40_7]